MADERTRSEYRFAIDVGMFQNTLPDAVNLTPDDRDSLAQLMLDAYRGSIDDEGETFDEARQAIDFYLDTCLRSHSWVAVRDGLPIGMSLVLIVEANGVHYIDPVAVARDHKQQGLGQQLVHASLASLAEAGVREVGATITDGNEPSERLFARLGATRVGAWPPEPA